MGFGLGSAARKEGERTRHQRRGGGAANKTGETGLGVGY